MRGLLQAEGHGTAPIEGEGDARYPSCPVDLLRVDDGDVIGGDRLGELRLPPLTRRGGHERARDPRGVEVSVNGTVGLVLGGERDRLAVAAGGDVDSADI